MVITTYHNNIRNNLIWVVTKYNIRNNLVWILNKYNNELEIENNM